ncbi:hypothetical protein MHYP_G00170310 [Metynnis hypsauchen]
MQLLLLMSLLFYSSIHTAQTVIVSHSETEGRDVRLACVNGGKVVWSKGTDGGRSAILTAEDGEITQRYSPDPENRYSVLAKDSSLVIRSVSLSDSGIYYCNAAPAVNLTVNPAPPARFTWLPTPTVSVDTEVNRRRTSEGGDKQKDNQPNRKGFLIALLVVGGVVLLLALAYLSIKKYFSEKKEACEMPYDDVYTTIEYVAFNKA